MKYKIWDIISNTIIIIVVILLASSIIQVFALNIEKEAQDVDNNGEIQISDLIVLFSHYGQSWRGV